MGISESKPWVSQNAFCHPSEVAKANEDLKSHGVQNAYYDRNGNLTAHSRKARAEALKASGYFDKDAGYGDYAGK
jgi:hypothetical protein